MELYVGGYKQGKLKYVRRKYEGRVAESDIDERIFNDFHLWVRELMMQDENVEEKILEYLELHPDCIIICDEIGNGIVPIDPFERRYREQVGRILAELAQRADHVERVICGLGICIK